ncbi:MAG TPA: SusD/RagB family nutrient-binding outer membrane lipoprotein [Chitinophagaceae bacterium]|nr:SusD/RagB family nutrient-binding outer membrane lipoprotein [Chitinophagaceae bacterium]HPG11934.1 SusD/RagB family nutrient-binding outer membrane lipoprotein [Chitinophagaceae bacterium]HRX92567.1 SusD/RagB family nutrient-binding outer membrane lipoprotein [Chitinophagaceae bacterium]
MKKIHYIVLAVFTLSITTSCNKFDELNTNPDVPTTVTSEMLATQLLKDTYRFWNVNPTDFGTGNLWAKHIVMLETNPNPYQYYYSYYPYGSFGGMQKLTTLKRMVELSAGNPTESSFKGLALFMKAWYGFGMTLDMGDVPYSEAGMAEDGVLKPKYDKQSEVFTQILADLKAAEEQFATGKTFDGDIMYNGNPVKWRRLSNAMQLKVIQTLSKKITPELKARFAAIVSAGNLLTEADNFQLVYSTNTNASHPYYNGETRRVLSAPSDLVVDFLKANQDRRLFYFAEPAAEKISGGLTQSDYDAYVGASTTLSADLLSLNRAAGKYSFLNKRYVAERAGDPMLQFTYSEQCFIIAEAIEEGWVSGSAQTYYENGVKAILKYYMTLPSATVSNLHGMAITQSYIDNYFTGEAAYKTGGTKQDRLKQIITQRWLLDFFQGNSLFSYKTFLRTGYPQFPLDPATSLNPEDPNVYPKRWKYPTSELTTNPENYNQAIADQYGGFDGINKVPWWLQ